MPRVHPFPPPPPAKDFDNMPRVLPFPPPPVTNVATSLSGMFYNVYIHFLTYGVTFLNTYLIVFFDNHRNHF